MTGRSSGGALVPLSALLLVGFGFISGWVALAGSLPGDRAAVVEIHDAVGARLDDPMTTLARATDGWPLATVVVAVVVVLALTRRRMAAILFASAVGVVLLVNPMLKRLFTRERPDVRPLPDDVSDYAFPSGHAAGTAALGVAVAMLVWNSRWRVPAVLAGVMLVASVAISQLVLGRHYPSDVVAGWLWATGWVVLVWSLGRRVRKRFAAG